MDQNVMGRADPSSAPAGFEHSSLAWRVLGALWLIALLVVAVPSVGASVLNAQMMVDLNMDRTAFGAGFGIFVLMMGFQGPTVAAVIRRFGYRATVTLGGLLLFFGSVAMATWVYSAWQYAVVFGLVIGTAVCMGGMLPAQSVVARWFTLRRAFAVSIVLSAIEIGGLLSPPALERLLALSGNNWRLGWWVIAGFALIAVVTARLVINEKAIDAVVATQRPVSQDGVFKSTVQWTLKQAIRARSYWFVLVYMGGVNVGWIFLMAHGVVHLRDLGYSPINAALAVAVTVAASFIGNMTAGLLGDRIAPSLIAAAGALLMAFGFLMIIAPQGFEGILLYAVPAGIGYGASQVCVMAMLGNFFGRESFSVMFGSMLPVSSVCAAAGAAVAGVIYDSSGSYQSMCLGIVAICVASSLLIVLTKGQTPKA